MAKTFQFRLEKLLDLRRAAQSQAERELAEAHRAVDERNRVILDLMNREDNAKNELRVLQQDLIDLGRLQTTNQFLISMERLLQREYEALQALVRVEMEKREKLTEARKGVRVLERFRERELRRHRQGIDREERDFLDEIGRNFAKGA